MELKLPDSIGGKRDLILAMRQVEQILNDRLQDEVRERFGAKRVGTKAGQRAYEDLLEVNKLKDDTETLKKLMQALEGLKQHSPKIRIAFAQEPDQDLYKQIVAWFRHEINPGLLVQVGVQPNIGGGFVLRTNARRYDMSLKTKILNSTPKFLEILNRTKYAQAVMEDAAKAQTSTDIPADLAAQMENGSDS